MAKIRVPQVRGGYRYTTFVCKDKLSQVRGKIYNICIAKLRVSQIRGEGRENNICMAKFRLAHVRGEITDMCERF